MKIKKRCRFYLLLLFFLLSFSLFAREISLGEIVVTPYQSLSAESLYSLPYAVEKFTQEDIEKTNAQSLVDFLKTTASINASDYYGTGVKANLDLMGFGDNSLSNVLVLVDGRRMNDVDLSGIDWTQIPLDDIDAIEIIKGAGCVLYGDNSDGGIINIITKKSAEKELSLKLKAEGGSYGFDQESTSVSGRVKKLSFFLYSQHQATNGYRKNSHYRSKYTQAKFNLALNKSTDLYFSFGHHRYRYGLAGALYQSEIENGTYSRRDSKYPNDNARMEDNFINLGLRTKLNEAASFNLDATYRNKNGLDNWLSYGLWNYTIDRHINSLNITPRLLLNFDFLNTQHKMVAGFDFFRADFSADEYYIYQPASNDFTDIDRKYYAFFLNDTIQLNDKLSLNAGLRREKEEFSFDYTSSTKKIDDSLNFTEEAYEGGVNYKFSQTGNAFLSFARAFRVPKTDEYFSAWANPPVNKNLHVQISKTMTSGLNLALGKKIKLKTDFFIMYIDHEIYYDPLTSSNANYDKTRHQGADLRLDLHLTSKTNMSLGYRYTQAKFRKGPYDGKEVPAVPHSKFTASLSQKFLKYFTIYLNTLYRSKVYLINDLNNALDKLDSFWVTNLKLSFKKGHFEIYCGINNIFNEKYSEYASTNSSASVRALYPSPERNYFLGIKIGW